MKNKPIWVKGLMRTVFIMAILGTMLGMPACGGENGKKISEPEYSEWNDLGDLDGDGILNKDDTDIDNDGLDNGYEDNTSKTSPYIADTDGDGWNDGEEWERMVNETYFNPLVSDLPRIELILKREPLITMRYTTTSGVEKTYSTSQSEWFTETHSASRSFTQTASDEYGWNVEAGLEFGYASKSPHFLYHVNVGGHGTYTTEDSHQWGQSDTVEHRSIAEEAFALGTQESLSQEGGKISAGVSFRNSSNIAFQVSGITLSAHEKGPTSDGYVKMIGNLMPESTVNFRLDPNTENDALFTFKNESLYVSEVLELLKRGNGIVVAIAGYQLTMGDTDFTVESTDVPTKTAKILIDYGPGINRDPEQYAVATKTSYNPDHTTAADRFNPVPLSSLMEIINVPIVTGETDGNQGIQQIREVEQQPEYNKYWFMLLRYTENAQDMIAIYGINKCSYDFSSLLVKTGYQIEFIYSEDQDADGLPLRTEKDLNTSDEDADSDGDGLDDFFEVVEYGTDPANPDTDGDNLRDDVDPDPLTPAVSSDATLSELILYYVTGAIIDHAQSVELDLTAPAAAVPVETIALLPTATAGSYSINIEKDGQVIDTVVSGEETDFIPLDVGQNPIDVTVTATDGTTTKTYSVSVDSIVPDMDMPSFVVSPTDKPDAIGLGWVLPNLDYRFNGYIILRSTISTGITIPTSEVNLTSYPSGASRFGGTVVYNTATGDSFDASEMTDESLLSGTTYYYVAACFYKSGTTYYFSGGITGSATTNTRPDARFRWNVYAFLNVDTHDGSTSGGEYQWVITAELLDPTGDPVGSEAEMIVAKGGTIEVNHDQYARTDNIKWASLAAGEYILFDDYWILPDYLLGYFAYEREIPGFSSGTTEADIKIYDHDALFSFYSPPEASGLVYDFPVPRTQDALGRTYTLRINVQVWEVTGGDSDPVATESFDFEYKYPEDKFKCEQLTYGQYNYNWNKTSQYLEKDYKGYIFNPYFESDNGDVQIFMYPEWSIQE